MPYDITIENSSSENIQFTVQDSSSTFTPVGSPAVLDVSDLDSALAYYNVTVTTGSESQGIDQGNLTVAAQIDSTGTTNLTLSAIHDLNIDSTITTSGSFPFVSGAAISLDGSTIPATGNQTYDGAVFLPASTTLTSPASGSISLDNTLDVGTYNLTLNTAGVAS